MYNLTLKTFRKINKYIVAQFRRVKFRVYIVFSKLYHSLSHKQIEKKKFLFWLPGGMADLSNIEGSIGAALLSRGHQVHAVICDGTYKACVKRDILDNENIKDWHKSCAKCMKSCKNILKGLNIPHSTMSEHLNAKEINKFATQSLNVKLNEPIINDNVDITDNVRSSVHRYLKGGNEAPELTVFQEYVFSGLISLKAAQNAINKYKPDHILMSHGIYVDWGPAVKAAFKYQVPVTLWMCSYLKHHFYFRNLEVSTNISIQNIKKKAWEEISAKGISVADNDNLMNYFINRYKQNKSFDMKPFQESTGELTCLYSKLDIQPDKPVWAILCHINWDGVTDYSPMLFATFNDWILKTIDKIKDIKDVQWLIKIHPAEMWEKSYLGVRELMNYEKTNLPKHIKVVYPELKLGFYDFSKIINGAITVYGTLGLELALEGKPVILAGDAHYGGKGFTYDPKTKEEYYQLLENTSYIKQLDSKTCKLAKIYAFNFFLKRQIPLPAVMNSKGHPFIFDWDNLYKIKEGKEPFMDFIIQNMLSGEEFILDECIPVNN